MKVILTKDVASVGKAGQMKEVSDGYARNYLIPQGFAIPASQAAQKEYESQQASSKRREAKAQDADRVLADEVSNMTVVFKVRVGEQHRLYGSITNSDIAEALSKKLKRPIDKHLVEVEEPLKHLGTFKVPVRIGRHFTGQLNVTLEPET